MRHHPSYGRLDFTAYQGTDFGVSLTFRDKATGAFIPVDTWVDLTARVAPYHGAPASEIPLTLAHVSTGVINITATLAQLAPLLPGLHHGWDMTRGNEVVLHGKFNMLPRRGKVQ